MADWIDLTGQRFGRWLVLARTERKKRVQFLCRCDCGTERPVLGSDLRKGKSRCCGCYVPSRKPPGTHAAEHPLYGTWAGMKQRCFYPGHAEFHRYGGRGITMDPRWENIEVFAADMGPKPPGTSIDRIDRDGPYCKENCRWATRAEQMRNTSKNIFVMDGAERICLKDYASRHGVRYYSVYSFIRRGFSLAEAVARSELHRKTGRYQRGRGDSGKAPALPGP